MYDGPGSGFKSLSIKYFFFSNFIFILTKRVPPYRALRQSPNCILFLYLEFFFNVSKLFSKRWIARPKPGKRLRPWRGGNPLGGSLDKRSGSLPGRLRNSHIISHKILATINKSKKILFK